MIKCEVGFCCLFSDISVQSYTLQYLLLGSEAVLFSALMIFMLFEDFDSKQRNYI